MKALEHNDTWDLVYLPTCKQVIGCKWVYNVKMNLDGSVAHLKGILVSKGHAQTYEVNYTDAFFLYG